MSPRPTTLALLLVLSLTGITLTTAPAAAAPPCGSCPKCITLVGTNGVVADPVGTFCVTATDPAACLPMPGVPITVDFSGCPGISICAVQPDPTMIVGCATKTVTKISDATGTACFDIVGGAEFLPGVPCPPSGCCHIYAAGVLQCSPQVATPDLDNMGGVNGSDLSAWLSMFFSGAYCQLGDYDCNGALTGADLSAWLGIFFGGGSAVSCPTTAKCL